VTSNQPGAQAVASFSTYVEQVTQLCLALDVSIRWSCLLQETASLSVWQAISQ